MVSPLAYSVAKLLMQQALSPCYYDSKDGFRQFCPMPVMSNLKALLVSHKFSVQTGGIEFTLQDAGELKK
jgi:hypothetical protein